MKIGLFSLYSTGHHLQYASGLKRGLEAISDHDITFVTLTATDHQESYFSDEEIRFLDSERSLEIEDRPREFHVVADTFVERFVSTQADDYDVIHLLYIDDILSQCGRHFSTLTEPVIVGDLIGPFFTRWPVSRNPYVHASILWLLGSSFAPVLERTVPRRTPHTSFWRDLLLYRALRAPVFDALLVHSQEAREYVEQLTPADVPTTRLVPHPAPDWSATEWSRRDARRTLGLPDTGPVLLFFGTLRTDKGIDLLLDTLCRYDGPEFTMFIAGPPVPGNEIDETTIEAVRRRSAVDVVTKLDYISDPEPYYRASDAVVMPYRRAFGDENTSMVLQEACAAGRPVITPNRGALGRLTTEFGLGLTFEQGSRRDLESTIASFVDRHPLSLRENLEIYAQRNTHERVATELLDVYATCR